MSPPSAHVLWLDELGAGDGDKVGGKNASLGEMTRRLKDRDIRVPDGFATTAEAYRAFLAHNQLEKPLRERLGDLDPAGKSLTKVGRSVRQLLLDAELPPELAEQVGAAYRDLSARYGSEAADVAVRSSATAEDLPDASFAGQQDGYLNVVGQAPLIDSVRRCYASLFTDRAIAYREEHGFDHLSVALSVGVQKMVRSDKAGAGVLFTIDTEHGFSDVVVVSAAWGLGEMVVQGRVDPDEYVVFKPLLDTQGIAPIVGRNIGDKLIKMVYAKKGESATAEVKVANADRRSPVLDDEEVLQLARWGCLIDEHYGRPMDVEWAKDGDSGDLYIVQARSETVQSRRGATTLTSYRLVGEGRRLVSGLAVGDRIAAGKASLLQGPDDFDRFQDGDVIVTEMTDPDWVPIMRRAAAVVTDHGGRTAHAAIVSRELGLPAVVGTRRATSDLADGQEITVSCAEGDEGFVYEGRLDFEVEETPLEDVPETATRVMINLAEPAAAFRWWRLPADGVGLARMEFIINSAIKVHPLALTRFDQLEDESARRRVEELVAGAEAVTRSIRDLIGRAHRSGVKVGICGEAPSNYPHFAEMLVEAGIDSISVSPDRLLQVKARAAEVEARRG